MGVEQNANKPDISFARELPGRIFVWIVIVGGVLTIADFLTVVGFGERLIGNWRVYFRGVWTYIGNILDVKISE
jgi:hypothetical protein